LVPDLDDQTDAYRHFPAADPNALYIVTIGGNDVRDLVTRGSPPVTGSTAAGKLAAAATEIAQEVGQLFQFGARHVLVTGIPDVGLIPYYTGDPAEAAKRALASQYSESLDIQTKTALQALSLPAGATLHTFSLLDFGDVLHASPATYNLTNLTQARTVAQQGALAPVGSGFLFFDQVHPSAQVHALTAAAILGSLPGGAADAAVAVQLGAKWLGAIEASGGSDTFTASLTAGQTYVFDALGVSGGAGSLADPKIRILSGGVVVAQDDDTGLGLDAHLSFTASASGDYTIEVSGVGVTAGSYVLQGPGLKGSDVTVIGGALDDVITAVSGANFLRGGDGNDAIFGGSGFDDTHGNVGDDTVHGGGFDDWVVGGQGADVLFGDAGGDLCYGNLGADTVDGGAGDDGVVGGQDNDVLMGGDGADFITGDRGDDTLTGGAGADTFRTFNQTGIDRVLDFSQAQGDHVAVDAGSTYTLSQVGADTVIDMGGGNQMILVGVQLASLTSGWITGG
jgi:Ca2+-binding RTX toxin-like protein